MDEDIRTPFITAALDHRDSGAEPDPLRRERPDMQLPPLPGEA